LASGYRPGGPNTALGVPREFSPDRTRNYELGAKSILLDGRLTVDASVYYIDWKDIQLFVLAANQQGYTANASRAKSQGVELSLESRPLPGLTVSSWVAFNHAKLTDNFPTGAAQGMSGDRLPNGSRFSGHLAVSQDFPLIADWTGFAGGSVSYTGGQQGLFTSTVERQSYASYARTDARLGAWDGSFVVTCYVNNLTDRRAAISGGLGSFPATAFQFIQPRTVGLNVSKDF